MRLPAVRFQNGETLVCANATAPAAPVLIHFAALGLTTMPCVSGNVPVLVTPGVVLASLPNSSSL